MAEDLIAELEKSSIPSKDRRKAYGTRYINIYGKPINLQYKSASTNIYAK